MFFFNTLYLQRVLGYSPLEAGLAFLPFTAGIIVGAGLSQSLVPKVGARELPVIGMALAIVGMLLFTRLQPDSEYLTDFLPPVILASIGMGLTFVPGHADRDERSRPGCRRGARIRALQHVAAGRRSPRPRDPVDARGGRHQRHAQRRRAALARQQAQALVDGFHVAYVGSAVLIAVALVSLLLLLSRQDVAAVGAGELEPVAA